MPISGLGWVIVASRAGVLSPGSVLESSGELKKSCHPGPTSGHLIQSLCEVEPGVSVY